MKQRFLAEHFNQDRALLVLAAIALSALPLRSANAVDSKTSKVQSATRDAQANQSGERTPLNDNAGTAHGNTKSTDTEHIENSKTPGEGDVEVATTTPRVPFIKVGSPEHKAELEKAKALQKELKKRGTKASERTRPTKEISPDEAQRRAKKMLDVIQSTETRKQK